MFGKIKENILYEELYLKKYLGTFVLIILKPVGLLGAL